MARQHDEQPAIAREAGAPANRAWREIAGSEQFRSLLRAKRRFVIPAAVFFVVYYFALPVMVGFFPTLMSCTVVGSINLAYIFALSQFVMAWGVMWLYLRAAKRWDAMEHEIVRRMTRND